MRLRPITLSFEEKYEKEFLENYHSNSVAYVRRVLILALIIYSSFGFLDTYLLPEYKKLFLLIRFCFGLPIIIAIYISTFYKLFIRYFQTLLTLGVFLIGLAPLSITILAEPPINYAYYAGIIVVIIFAYTTVRLRFIYASVICWFFVILYNILAVYVNKTPTYILINNNFFLIASNIAGGIASYLIEYFMRKDFYLLKLLEEEKEKVNTANLELEEKIRERTYELIETNKILKVAKEKAEKSDKLKSQFISNMSHEFRTPLNGILGFAQLLKSDLPDKQKNNYLDIISNKGNQLLDIINNIIEISKIESKQLDISETSVVVNDMLHELGSVFKHKYPGKNNISITVENEFPLKESVIIADLSKLRQVLMCLIDNAFKFTAEGNITIGYRLANENYLNFYVKDTGIGIPEKHIAKIFERFYQVDNSDTRSFEGTGLGLSLTKGLIEILGGEIFVESTPEKGSNFYFTIPYKKSDKKVIDFA